MSSTGVTAPCFGLAIDQPEARARLFCFHHAGGSAAFFRPWAKLLVPSVALWPVELSGHGSRLREPLEADLRRAAQDVALSAAAHTDKPYALFGHSMGAILALECAMFLHGAGCRLPSVIVASGCPAPLTRRGTSRHLLDREGLLQLLRQLNGTSEELLEHKELVELVLPILRNDLRAVETYEPDPDPPRLACPIVVLGGVDDGDTASEQLSAWGRYSALPAEVHMFEGGHFFISACRLQVVGLVDSVIRRAAGWSPIPAP